MQNRDKQIDSGSCENCNSHREKQIEEIQQFAIDIQNASQKASNILLDETHEFLSQKHKYNSLKDFHKAHPKGRCQMEAEFLSELGYRKASAVAEEIFSEIERVAMSKIDADLSIATLDDTYYIQAIDEVKEKYIER